MAEHAAVRLLQHEIAQGIVGGDGARLRPDGIARRRRDPAHDDITDLTLGMAADDVDDLAGTHANAFQNSLAWKILERLGILPERPSMLEAKQWFEAEFQGAVYDGLLRVEKVRQGMSAEAVFKPSFRVVFTGRQGYCVEVFLRRNSVPEMVGPFSDYHQARAWIRTDAARVLSERGYEAADMFVVE